jgi:hypothetical protein
MTQKPLPGTVVRYKDLIGRVLGICPRQQGCNVCWYAYRTSPLTSAVQWFGAYANRRPENQSKWYYEDRCPGCEMYLCDTWIVWSGLELADEEEAALYLLDYLGGAR